MNKIIYLFLILLVSTGVAYAGCSENKLGKPLLQDRMTAGENIVKSWIEMEPISELVSDAAVIISSEVYLSNICEDEVLWLSGMGANPELSLFPAEIMEALIGEEILSPKKHNISR